MRYRGGAQRGSDAAEKRRTIKNSDAPAPRLLSRWSEWETEKVRADTQKTHGNAQEVQKAQKNAEKAKRKHKTGRNHTAREMKRRDGQGDKNAVHDETLL